MIHLQLDPIDVASVERSVHTNENGAVIVFVGRTRNHFAGREVLELFYEAYDSMALKQMHALAEHITDQCTSAKISIVHRLGRVPIGEASVVIAVSTPHRDEGYKLSRMAIDILKETVPIWKKEIYKDGAQWKANQSTT